MGEGGWNGVPERKKVAFIWKIIEKENPESKVDLFMDVFFFPPNCICCPFSKCNIVGDLLRILGLDRISTWI